MAVRHQATRRLARLAPVGVVLAALVTAPAVQAADPTPAASAAPVSPPANIEAWLDADFVTPDAPPGGVLEAGFSFWDTRQQEFLSLGGAQGVYVLLRPGTGSAAPSEASIQEDFPGHVVADMVVPEGGPGDVEVGMVVNACVNDVCSDQRAPFQIAGTGPPPGAKPEELIGAEILPLVGDTVVGREFPVTVNVLSRGLWDFSTLPLPDHLLVVARHPGGAELSTGELRPGATPGAPYTGKLTIPETGDVEISIAVPLDLGGSREIEGATVQRTVIEGGRRTEAPAAAASQPAAPLPTSGATNAPAGSSGGIPGYVWILGAGALVIGGLFVLNRVLRDL
ncbi:MAG TPA: hypothetical protein VFV72_00850 [Candidatus Limnocylindrales bacterium]|nr:hypothetical protein [Candidatus Limnocylindrales bacterium]